MQISGELVGNTIIIQRPKEIGRLFNKSHFGTPQSGNTLQLDLIEAVFLLDDQKIRVFQKRKEVGFQDLVILAAQQIPDFETKYLVFKDLRNRGHAIKRCQDDRPTMFYRFKEKKDETQPCYIAAFSERDILDIDAIQRLLITMRKKNGILWFALVDEEGDITYYEISPVTLKGDTADHRFSGGTSVFLKNRLIVFDPMFAQELLQKEFFGKPFGHGLQLSFVEALYLMEKNILSVQTPEGKTIPKEQCLKMMQQIQPDINLRLHVFCDLKQRGLLVKTGFKFGTHFRAYTQQPDVTHAEYLIHGVEKGFTCIWAEMSRGVRLAHSVNKEFVFARVDGPNIDYIKLGRLRP